MGCAASAAAARLAPAPDDTPVAPQSLTVLVAFSAGLLSFLSPCVLPLVPSYITFITGLGLEDVSRARRTTLVHALLFVLGFSFIFVALGAGATAFGQLMLTYRGWIARIGGALMVLMGLWMLGVQIGRAHV